MFVRLNIAARENDKRVGWRGASHNRTGIGQFSREARAWASRTSRQGSSAVHSSSGFRMCCSPLVSSSSKRVRQKAAAGLCGCRHHTPEMPELRKCVCWQLVCHKHGNVAQKCLCETHRGHRRGICTHNYSYVSTCLPVKKQLLSS